MGGHFRVEHAEVSAPSDESAVPTLFSLRRPHPKLRFRSGLSPDAHASGRLGAIKHNFHHTLALL